MSKLSPKEYAMLHLLENSLSKDGHTREEIMNICDIKSVNSFTVHLCYLRTKIFPDSIISINKRYSFLKNLKYD